MNLTNMYMCTSAGLNLVSSSLWFQKVTPLICLLSPHSLLPLPSSFPPCLGCTISCLAPFFIPVFLQRVKAGPL